MIKIEKGRNLINKVVNGHELLLDSRIVDDAEV